MGFPSVTYTFANSTTADATQVNQNFTDIINGVSDGTKNINISALTAGGTSNLQGSVTLGASSANILTVNCALGSSIAVQTTNAYDVGADATGIRSIYFGSGGSAHSTRLIGASVSSAWTMTLPTTAGSSGYLLQTDGTGVTSWSPFQRSATDAQNIGITSSVSLNAMTIGVTDGSGSALSGSDLANIVFRNATATTGTVSLVSPSSITSLVIPSGATLGQTSAVNQYVWVYLLNNAGTAEIAVSGVKVFDNGSIQSTTAITSGSTSGTVLYSTSNRSNVAIRLIGRILVNEATAGTWASSATEITMNPLVVPNITDWVQYTPTFTGFGTPSSVGCFSRRVGDTLEVRLNMTSGTPTATQGQITLGFNGTNANVTIDSNKITGTALVGKAAANFSASTFFGEAVLGTGGNGYLTFGAQESTTSEVNSGNGNLVASNGVSFEFFAAVPITGWSAYGP